jgi:hypothetical protein
VSTAWDALRWLMHWYERQCDGDWEHQWGVKIDTLDNPGWSLEIDLENTEFEDRPFARVEHNLQSDRGWWVCWVENRQFHAACGPVDLAAVIEVFKGWVEATPPD